MLADIDGVRSAMSEHGARRVGRDYDLEPIAVSGGVFHAKLSALAAPDDTHLLVGSGNLTFGGWGGNLESVEHLHPSFAGDAFIDASGFFEALAASSRIKTEAQEKLGEIAATLRRAGEDGARSGRLRLIHGLGGSITDQIVAIADELGGATRLTVASPFWDGGRAVTDLCGRLNLDHAYVHAHHQGVVETGVGDNWPRRTALTIHPVELAFLVEETGKRRLHAKMFEILCRRGRLVVSGSANATQAALGPGGNVEACVVRIERQPQTGWLFGPSSPLPAREVTDEESEPTDAQAGVLRAVLEGGMVVGRVLTPFPSGLVTAYQVSSDGQRTLGEAEVSAEGRFSFRCEELEREAWNSGRLILRLGAASSAAEGFISFADLQAVRLRAGPIAAKLLAVLANGDTPADAAAIMSWFHDNPAVLARGAQGSWGGGSAGPSWGVVDIKALLAPHGQDRGPGTSADGPNGSGWERFIATIFASFSLPRGPFSEETSEDADSETEETDPRQVKRAIERREAEGRERKRQVVKALGVFDSIFEKMLGSADSGASVGAVFALAQYVCERLRPEDYKARDYLSRLVEAFVAHPSDEERGAATAAVFVAAMLDPSPLSAARRARWRLLRLGVLVDEADPDLTPAAGFQRLLCPNADPSEMLAAIKSVTTIPEEIQLFREALEAGEISCELPILGSTPEWSKLQSAVTPARARKDIKFVARSAVTCPCSSSVLPAGELRRLRSSMIATAPCGHILLCEEL